MVAGADKETFGGRTVIRQKKQTVTTLTTTEPENYTAGKMIPFERFVEERRKIDRILWLKAWAILLILIAMGGIAVWATLGHGGRLPMPAKWWRFVPQIMFGGLTASMIASIFWMRFTALRCPVCQTRFIDQRGLGKVMVKGRCASCRTVVTTPAPRRNAEEKSRQQRANRRIAYYVAAAALLGTPTVIQLLAAYGVLRDGPGPWQMTFIFWGLELYVALLPLSIVWLCRRLNKRNESQASASTSTPVESPYPFLTLIPTAARRGFRLYLTPDLLCFAHVTDKVYLYAENMATAMESKGKYLVMPAQSKAWWEKSRLENIYNGMDVRSLDFLEMDSANFQVRRDEVEGYTYTPIYKQSIRQLRAEPRAAGILELAAEGHGVLKFRLMDDLSKDEVVSLWDKWFSEHPSFAT